MKNITLTAIILTGIAALTSCAGKQMEADASGVFETDEVLVSAEASGKILQLDLTEGAELEKGQTVGVIDSVQLYLSKLQLQKSMTSVEANRPDVSKQLAVLRTQLDKLLVEQKRVDNLLKAKAATPKQADDIASQIAVLQSQIDATRSQLDNSVAGIDAQSSAMEIQVAQMEDRLRKCYITSPVSGTVIARYAREGEMAVAGKPLFRVADLKRMYLKAYFTLGQLKDVKIGQKVSVTADFGGGNVREYEGVVGWISPKAEFTPKSIVTKDDRENLVYATKIMIENDGYVKIGMYGEVNIND